MNPPDDRRATPDIRRATSDDLSIIQDIARRTWPTAFEGILSPEQIAFMLDWMYSTPSLSEQMLHKGHVFLLAYLEGRPVGFCGYELHYSGRPVTRIHKIYLLPEVQGRGVGGELLGSVVAIARSNGDTHLNLNVNRFNKAVGFYQKFGFTIVHQEDIDIGRGFLMEDFVMEMPV